MNIQQSIPILKKQKTLERTPFGRLINEKAMSFVEATIQDQSNYTQESVQCTNCGLVFSFLLTEQGCPNCGVEELTTNVIEGRK